MGRSDFGGDRIFTKHAMGIGVVPGQRRDGDGKIFVEVFFGEFRPALFCVGDAGLCVRRVRLRLRPMAADPNRYHHHHRTKRRGRNLGCHFEGAWWTALGDLNFSAKKQ